MPLVWSVGSDSAARPAARRRRSSQAPRTRRPRQGEGGGGRRPREEGASRSRKASVRPRARAASGGSARSGSCCSRRSAYLSFQATRNSHQFAAVVGTVTAWNFGEWAAAVRRRRPATATPARRPRHRPVAPRLVARCRAIVAVLAWVGSGSFYRMTGEGRTIGLGEEPLWFPHEAVRFAGRPEMPERFLSFHNGHASLFEYYHGPERKVYTDPRLEVIGAELYERYMELEQRILERQRPRLAGRARPDRPAGDPGRPRVQRASVAPRCSATPTGGASGSTRSPRCSSTTRPTEAVRPHAVDFAARHFRPGRRRPMPKACRADRLGEGVPELRHGDPPTRADLSRPLVWLGLDDCPEASARAIPNGRRRLEAARPDRDRPRALEPAGQSALSPPLRPGLRPLDRRATYALRRAQELAPDDFTTLMMLAKVFEDRRMDEAELSVLDPLVRLRPINLLPAEDPGREGGEARAAPGATRAVPAPDLGEPERP